MPGILMVTGILIWLKQLPMGLQHYGRITEQACLLLVLLLEMLRRSPAVPDWPMLIMMVILILLKQIKQGISSIQMMVQVHSLL